MSLDPPTRTPWLDPAGHWAELSRATAHLDAPLGVLSLEALAHNAHELVARANGVPIRVASKSIRVRDVVDSVLRVPGYAGVLAFSLAEALWLARDHDDIVVAYPTTDRTAIADLVRDPVAAARVTLMVDSLDQLDLVDAVAAASKREPVRVALEIDVSFERPLLGRVGAWRSPITTTDAARALAASIVARPGFRLVGVMAYEGQIAGVPDRPPGAPVRGALLRAIQRASLREVIERRGAAVAAIRQLAELEFVNGGGTGSLERTATDPSVTELAAGSGLFAPHLFDGYSAFAPAPAAAFALDVVRKPAPDRATLFGGGWIASGPTGRDRSPSIEWPRGLRFVAREGAGEVQTPVEGAAARSLRIGDRVWLRHAKAGELSEHVDRLHLVEAGSVVGESATYRGEGRVFV